MTVTGRVVEVEVFGHARLSISVGDFRSAGFAPGDIVTVKAGIYEGDMPFFTGYFTGKGEPMIRALPDDKTIAVCINYGRFAEIAGVDIGDPVTVSLKKRAGALAQQEISFLAYEDNREDYESDEVFGNFREITAGNIGKGRLYRSASPVNNEHRRAACVNALAERAGVRTVMNMGDTLLEIRAYSYEKRFESAYYMDLYDRGQVIALGMPIDFQSEEMNRSIVLGLTFLADREPPYLLHCNEGKDRTGFAAILLEALMGASLKEIGEDYLISYENYYHLDPVKDAAKLGMIAKRDLHAMLRWIAGTGEAAFPAETGLAAAAEKYLMRYGMSRETVERLKEKLKGETDEGMKS